jgi:hypothetical protein
LNKFEWEKLHYSGPHEKTDRAKVPGGWIVRTAIISQFGVCVSIVKIDDPAHKWQLE